MLDIFIFLQINLAILIALAIWSSFDDFRGGQS